MSTELSFDLSWTFLTDWHVGSGLERPGSFDALVQRDDLGLPFLPGKTQTGIIRDKAEEIAETLGPKWKDWLGWLLGDQSTQRRTPEGCRPRGAMLSIRPASLQGPLREWRGIDHPQARELVECLYFGKPGVKIDANGQAEENCLRIIEFCRGGITLEGTARLDVADLDGKQIECARHLLALAAGSVERLGGKRRRGAGKVQLQIKETGGTLPTPAEIADWLENHPEPPDVPRCKPRPPALAIASPRQDEWHDLPFRLELKTPALITERTIGNVVKTLDFIPGTFLLPLVARVLRSKGLEGEIVAGNVRISHATLMIDDKPTRPVPACLRRSKDDQEWFKVVNLLRNAFVDGESPEFSKDIREGYVTEPDDDQHLPIYEKVKKTLRPHNTVHDERQRPTQEVGGVYSYEAIAAGQRFQGVLSVRESLHEKLGERWWESIEKNPALGRSKKDDYGQTVLTWLDDKKDEAPAIEPAKDGHLTVWLTSDTLLLDDNMRPATRAEDLFHALKDLFDQKGVKLLDYDREHPYVHHRRLESWHNGWGLPRPSLVAIAAGSCIRIKIEANGVTSDILQAIQKEGLGLRQAEGFGRFCLQAQLVTQTPQGKAVAARGKREARWSPDDPLPPLHVSDPAQAVVVDELLRECWRRRIRLRVLEIAHTPDNRNNALGFENAQPNPSQAGTARAIVRLPAGHRTAVAEEVITKARRRNAPSGDGSWPVKLKELIEKPDRLWDLLQANGWPARDDTTREQLKQSLQDEALRSLVDAVAKAHVRRLQGNRED